MNCYDIIKETLSIQARNVGLPLSLVRSSSSVTATLGIERASFHINMLAALPDSEIEAAVIGVGRRLIENNRLTRIKAIDVTWVKPRKSRSKKHG